MLLTLEGPLIQAAIARLPDVTIMLAAAGIVLSLQVTIESPVIMLLSTSTALATSPQAYRVLSRFVLHLNILLTVIAATIAFVDPVYNWLVPGLMGIPTPVAEAAQPAMKIMTFWSAAIGWRRFYQGILIRFNQTKLVGYGTAVRLTSVAVSAVTLAVFTELPGVIVGAYTWMAGVGSEMIYAYLTTRPIIAEHLSGPDDPDEPALTYSEVVKYHTPLAATSLMTLLTQPLIGAGLARMAFPEENLAAWPVIFSVLLFFRSFGFALPETIIALLKEAERLAALRRFSMRVVVSVTVVVIIFVFTPLLNLYLLYVTGVTPELVQFIVPGVIAGLLIPGLHAYQSWLRGILMVTRITADVYWGMGLNLATTAIALAIGVFLQTPGAPTAAVSLTIGMVAEAVYLWWKAGVAQTRLGFAIKPVGG